MLPAVSDLHPGVQLMRRFSSRFGMLQKVQSMSCHTLVHMSMGLTTAITHWHGLECILTCS